MKWFILSFTLCLVSLPTFAEKLIVGVENIDYYPIYATKEGKYQGYARDLLDSFAKKYGYTFVYKPRPIKRLFNDFLAGQMDLKFPDNQLWASDQKKNKNIIYSDSALEYIDGVLVTEKRLNQGKDKIKKLGIIRGFTPWEYLGDITAGKIKAQENTTMAQLMKMAKTNRIDAVYFNILVARYFLKHSEFDKHLVQYDSSLPHTQDHYHLSSIKHPEVIEKFNDFLKKETKTINQLIKKYELEL